MQNVIEQEKEICSRLNARDPYALKALDDMLIFFEYDDNLRPTVHPILIKTIYIEQKNKTRWKLTNTGNIGNTTSYRYRHAYIDYFYIRYNAAKAKAEAAMTSDR